MFLPGHQLGQLDMKLARMQEQALLDLEVKWDLAHTYRSESSISGSFWRSIWWARGGRRREGPVKGRSQRHWKRWKPHHLELLAIYRRCGRRALDQMKLPRHSSVPSHIGRLWATYLLEDSRYPQRSRQKWKPIKGKSKREMRVTHSFQCSFQVLLIQSKSVLRSSF